MSRTRAPASRMATEIDTDAARFAADVQYYLSQDPRQLPSRYLYDALGSALFEAICRLPWYRITRAEKQLLLAHRHEVLRRVRPSTVIELGSGSGEKLRMLLDGRESDRDAINVHLVDVSPSALEASAQVLQAVTGAHVTAHRAPYEDGLRQIDLQGDDRALVLFLGSNIGNYDPPAVDAFLRAVRAQLRQGSALLLGADLVKPERELVLAYDDPLQVTAAFNRNLLVRINRELGGDFDITQFAHEAVWNARESRMEMHLVARSPQEVRIRAPHLAFTMGEGERIWTESSYKYEPDKLAHLLEAAGFRTVAEWFDHAARFELTLVEAV